MVPALRYLVALPAVTAVFVALLIGLTLLHPILRGHSPAGLLPLLVAALLGGVVGGAVVPHHKVLLAALFGIAMSAAVIAFMSSLPESTPVPSSWNIYIVLVAVPAFAVGGYLSRNLWQYAQPTVQPDGPASGGSTG
jgi:hypothetical protein